MVMKTLEGKYITALEAWNRAVKKGDKVTTIGGSLGVVTNVKESTVMVKVDDNCKLEFTKSAVSYTWSGSISWRCN